MLETQISSDCLTGPRQLVSQRVLVAAALTAPLDPRSLYARLTDSLILFCRYSALSYSVWLAWSAA